MFWVWCSFTNYCQANLHVDYNLILSYDFSIYPLNMNNIPTCNDLPSINNFLKQKYIISPKSLPYVFVFKIELVMDFITPCFFLLEYP